MPHPMEEARLVHLEGGIDVADEQEGAEEPNGAGGDEKAVGQDSHVAEVDGHGSHGGHVESGGEVLDGIEEEVEPAGAGVQEGAPPPPVVLIAQLEVHQYDGDFGTSHHEDDEDDGEETKDIVKLVEPQGGQDEVQFDERSSEGDGTPGKDHDVGLHVPPLVRDEAGDRANALRGLKGRGLVTCTAPKEDQRDADEEPESN